LIGNVNVTVTTLRYTPTTTVALCPLSGHHRLQEQMQPLSLDNTSVPKADNPVHDQSSACSHNPATLLQVSPSEASDVETRLSTEILTYQAMIPVAVWNDADNTLVELDLIPQSRSYSIFR
jgi:hypothetical protein